MALPSKEPSLGNKCSKASKLVLMEQNMMANFRIVITMGSENLHTSTEGPMRACLKRENSKVKVFLHVLMATAIKENTRMIKGMATGFGQKQRVTDTKGIT